MLFFIPYGTKEKAGRMTFPYINVGLVALNILVFIYEIYLLSVGGIDLLSAFTGQYAAIPSTITDGTPLETGLLTSMFLHAGLLHILGNMIYLLPFGDNIEDRIGHFKYLIFYLLCGVAATAGFSLLNPDTTTPLLGASGAIAGVLGGYLALHPRGVVKGFLVIVILFTRLDLPALVFIGYWFILQIFSSAVSLNTTSSEAGGVAYSAHIIGFFTGLLLMPLLMLISPSRRESASY
jgi:membrane associated rhomboid family serine protease